jgi:hypothetical protein
MKKLLVVLAVAFSGVLNAQIEYVDYKHGDNDAQYTFGLLETLFTDTLTKGNFGIFDQSIFKLNVLDKYSNPITNFKNWIDTLNVSQYPNDKFIFLFTTTSEYVNSESIDIINRSTKEVVRMISIAYSDFNYATNRYTNVVSVADLIIR